MSFASARYSLDNAKWNANIIIIYYIHGSCPFVIGEFRGHFAIIILRRDSRTPLKSFKRATHYLTYYNALMTSEWHNVMMIIVLVRPIAFESYWQWTRSGWTWCATSSYTSNKTIVNTTQWILVISQTAILFIYLFVKYRLIVSNTKSTGSTWLELYSIVYKMV